MSVSPVGPSDLLRTAAQDEPSRIALVSAGLRFDYAGLDRAVSAAAHALRDAGLRPGDRLALQLPTGADFVQLYLGALRAGLVAVPLNPAYTATEVEHVLTDSRSALHLDAESGRQLLAGATAGADPRLDRGPDELAVLLYTSGTSGLAKGAMLPARALIANLEQLAAVEPPLLHADDVLFLALPFTHIFGLNAGLGMALHTRATLVLADRFDPGATLASMAAERVTAVLGVPGQFAAWQTHPARRDGFASVRFAMSGSTTLARGVVDSYAAAGLVVHDGYGLTEASPVVTITAQGGGRARPDVGSVGTPLPGVEVELRDTDGLPVDDGDPGRIFVRGANLFTGYWPDGAGGPDADGWFGTGDLAVADDSGALRLVGRATELVIVNGFNVYPAEVETVLAALPTVAEVAVVGVPDAGTGEAVRAYVVPTPGMAVDPVALIDAASRSLARFKLPRDVEIVDALPRTVTGKIMKWQMHDAAE